MSYVVLARWKAQLGEEDDVEAALRQLQPASRAEPGCIGYQVHRAVEDPTLFVIYEEYADRAAFEDHRGSPHFERYGLSDAIPRLEERVVTALEKLAD
jgi:quinol monooxygenase YgiN